MRLMGNSMNVGMGRLDLRDLLRQVLIPRSSATNQSDAED